MEMEGTPGSILGGWEEASDKLIGIRSEMPIGYNLNKYKYFTDCLLWRVGWAVAHLLFCWLCKPGGLAELLEGVTEMMHFATGNL